MVPDDENVSAFAVYSGKTSTKSKKKRMKMKQRKSLDQSLSKVEKIEIIQKKKKKKQKVLNSKSNANDITNSEETADAELSKPMKKLLMKKNVENSHAKVVSKKKPKKLHTVSESRIPVSNTNLAATSNKLAREGKKSVLINNGESEMNSAFESYDDINISEIKKSNLVSEDELVDGGRVELLTGEAINDLVYTKPKKKPKVLSIVEPKLPPRTGFKKPVVSTPKAVKRTGKLVKPKSYETHKQSGILKNVDDFLAEKERTDVVLFGSENSSGKVKRARTEHKLAGQVKEEILKKGTSEAFGKVTLEKILEPYSIDAFFKEHWERKPLHIIGKRKDKFLPLISTEMIDSVLRDSVVLFGKHLDVTVYADGKRETHNLEGRAHAHVVWDFYSNGCSVRLLNPQYFMNTVHILNSALQEYFGCFVGANAYLTPPNSQGFAPHYDDIEAFILQVEGTKYWRIYPPISKDGYLPRFSSRNLSDEEIGQPLMEVKLSPGDILYFPRGFIHQGRTIEEHSLHITLSVYQKTAWCDFLEKLLPLTLKKAASQDVEYRKGLPIGYLKSGGIAHKNSEMRKLVVGKVKKLIGQLNEFLETDAALDQMGLSFIQDALPPVLTPNEAACSVTAGGWRMNENGKLTNEISFSLNTSVRWIREYCYRVLEEDVTLEDGTIERQTRIYHSLDNSREYHKEEPQFVIVPPTMVPAVMFLVSAYPKFTKISQLPCGDNDEKMALVGDLWDRGLIMTESPLEVVNAIENKGDADEILTKEEMEVVAELDEPTSDNEGDSSVDEDGEEGADDVLSSSESLETEMSQFATWQKESRDDEIQDN